MLLLFTTSSSSTTIDDCAIVNDDNIVGISKICVLRHFYYLRCIKIFNDDESCYNFYLTTQSMSISNSIMHSFLKTICGENGCIKINRGMIPIKIVFYLSNLGR